jgi:hypothetical protein
MHVDEFSAKFKAKGAKFWATCIFDTINKFFDFLIDDLLKHLPLFPDVDHKNEVVPSFAPLFKSHY